MPNHGHLFGGERTTVYRICVISAVAHVLAHVTLCNLVLFGAFVN